MIRRTVIILNVKNLRDTMPRYPEMSVPGALRALDYTGTSVFAISGSMTAALSGMDLLGATVVGCLTALGGGTLRDILFSPKTPIFWMDEQEYVYMSVWWASLAFFICFWTEAERNYLDEILFWGDTIGLGAFAVIAAMFCVRKRFNVVFSLGCILITCTGGGVIRDTLCRRPARVLHAHQEVYAETAMSGGAVYMFTRFYHIPLSLSIVAGVSTVVALRKLAHTYDFRMATLPAALHMPIDHISIPTSMTLPEKMIDIAPPSPLPPPTPHSEQHHPVNCETQTEEAFKK